MEEYVQQKFNILSKDISKHDIIIGRDVMKALNISIDFGSGTAQISNRHVPLEDTKINDDIINEMTAVAVFQPLMETFSTDLVQRNDNNSNILSNNDNNSNDYGVADGDNLDGGNNNDENCDSNDYNGDNNDNGNGDDDYNDSNNINNSNNNKIDTTKTTTTTTKQTIIAGNLCNDHVFNEQKDLIDYSLINQAFASTSNHGQRDIDNDGDNSKQSKQMRKQRKQSKNRNQGGAVVKACLSTRTVLLKRQSGFVSIQCNERNIWGPVCD